MYRELFEYLLIVYFNILIVVYLSVYDFLPVYRTLKTYPAL